MNTDNKLQFQILNKLFQTSQEKVENLRKYTSQLNQVIIYHLIKGIFTILSSKSSY